MMAGAGRDGGIRVGDGIAVAQPAGTSMTNWVTVPLLSLVLAAAATAGDPMQDLEAACPCAATGDGGAWQSHEAYVACVATELRGLQARGAVRGKAARTALRAARASNCGHAALTRCCVYATDDDAVGRCRLVTAAACEALDDRMDDGEADDAGSGSCLPNPCAG
jgi:hypothetical protein